MLEISYDLEQKTSYAKILADMCIQFETCGEEDYSIGTPKCWDDAFLNRVNIDDYDVYHICYCLVRTGSYNSVTDYKKIWGLTEYLTDYSMAHISLKMVRYTSVYLVVTGKNALDQILHR